MSITFIQPIAAGNALRLFIAPPRGARRWRLLRRTNNKFAGPDDAGAAMVADGDDHVVVDTLALANGTNYFYCVYFWNGVAWTPSEIASAVPQATYSGDDVDPQSIVQNRLELGLAVEVAQGRLKPDSGSIRVTTAPFSLETNIKFPTVSVHMDSDAPAERAIGEMLLPDHASADGFISESSEGYLSRASLNIVGVSLNMDERKALRRAIKRIIIANLSVFDSFGMVLIQFSQRDDEDFTASGAPLYQTIGSFDCQFPSIDCTQSAAVQGADVTVGENP